MGSTVHHQFQTDLQTGPRNTLNITQVLSITNEAIGKKGFL